MLGLSKHEGNLQRRSSQLFRRISVSLRAPAQVK
jgi:hypothetical protein